MSEPPRRPTLSRPPPRPLTPAPVSAPVRVRPATTPARPASAPTADGLSRLNKRLAELGLCSRREADDWIANGWVQVNGQVAGMGVKVRPDDRIDVDPAARGQQANQVTILLNKPMGFVSGQAEDGHQPAATLFTAHNRWRDDNARFFFHPSQLRGLAPAGRLDIDSIGLLVLTQDGRVARQLIGEDSTMEKEYLVRVSLGDLTTNVQAAFPPAQLARLRHGLSLDGQPLKPAQVDWQNPEQLRFVLTEGKKRQIRRMCELVGLKVVGLKRIRIGNVVLGNLPIGSGGIWGRRSGFESAARCVLKWRRTPPAWGRFLLFLIFFKPEYP